MGVKRNSSVLLVCLLVYVLVTVVDSQDAKGDNSKDDRGAYRCFDGLSCLNDSDASFVYYRNDSFCCDGGHAILFSVSGFGYKYTKAFYSHVDNDDDGVSNNSSSGSSSDNSGGKNKRGASKSDRSDRRRASFRCMCKPVDDSGLDVDVYGMSVSAMTNDGKDTQKEVHQALEQIFGGADLTAD